MDRPDLCDNNKGNKNNEFRSSQFAFFVLGAQINTYPVPEGQFPQGAPTPLRPEE